MKILTRSIQRLIVELRNETFAVIPRLSLDSGNPDHDDVREHEAKWISKYAGTRIVGVKKEGDDWKDSGLFQFLVHRRDDEDDFCACREARWEEDFIDEVLTHVQAFRWSGFLYHRGGQKALWWIGSDERLLGFEQERLDAMGLMLIRQEGWSLDGLKYPEPSNPVYRPYKRTDTGRLVEDRSETFAEWMKSVGVKAKGTGAAVGRAKR